MALTNNCIRRRVRNTFLEFFFENDSPTRRRAASAGPAFATYPSACGLAHQNVAAHPRCQPSRTHSEDTHEPIEDSRQVSCGFATDCRLSLAGCEDSCHGRPCHPCKFFASKIGCHNGEQCGFCHLHRQCNPSMRQRRKAALQGKRVQKTVKPFTLALAALDESLHHVGPHDTMQASETLPNAPHINEHPTELIDVIHALPSGHPAKLPSGSSFSPNHGTSIKQACDGEKKSLVQATTCGIDAKLVAELKNMTLQGVKKRAREMGVGQDTLDDADAQEDPQHAVIELIAAEQTAASRMLQRHRGG